MRYFLIFIFLINIVILSAEDSFYLNFSETQKIGFVNNSIDINGIFVNNSGETRKYSLKLVNLNIPVSWSFFICDPYSCLAPETSESIFEYPASDTGHIKISFFTGDSPDTASLDLILTDLNDSGLYCDTIHLKAITRQLDDIIEIFHPVDSELSAYYSEGKLHIKGQNISSGMVIQIADLSGRIFFMDKINNISEEFINSTIEIKNYPAGIYFLIAENNRNIFSVPFLVEK
ncbi:MAG: hypothetical protein QG635_530 [Bacteroidota bacterium]|nr:hypothetical protein [Bacteroidota bacterium]